MAVINNLPAHQAKIINILDFSSEKLSINPFCFWLLMV